MNRRSRLPAALLALFALLAYVGEGIAAPPCPPEMETHAAEGVQDSHAHHLPAPGDAAPPAPEPCPLGMAAGGTCVAPPLPAAAAAPAAVPLDRTLVTPYLDDAHGRLAVAAHFRPPRA